MSIKTPGKHFYSDSPVKAMIKWRRVRRMRKSVVATLMVTPMIDIFAVITLFLLANFSATGEILFMQKDIKIPKATKSSDIERSPVVTISKNKITLEGWDVGESFIGRTGQLNEKNWEIEKLSLKLLSIKKVYYDDKGLKFPGTIIIQADKDLEFLLIKRVMFTCTQAGYFNINFAVMKATKEETQT